MTGSQAHARANAVARLVEASRKAQGLPPTVTDNEVLARVAAILRDTAEAKP
jgi:hypothetical protein